jgi:hypothetical protein
VLDTCTNILRSDERPFLELCTNDLDYNKVDVVHRACGTSHAAEKYLLCLGGKT